MHGKKFWSQKIAAASKISSTIQIGLKFNSFRCYALLAFIAARQWQLTQLRFIFFLI